MIFENCVVTGTVYENHGKGKIVFKDCTFPNGVIIKDNTANIEIIDTK